MKKIILKELTFVNWRGLSYTTSFNSDITTISGANDTGKSRHFDGFLWLLFGKDSQDRKDYEVRTRINGEIQHREECSIEGVIDVDGEQIRIKRCSVEKWVKPHGQIDEVFSGNVTECFWDGVPIKVNDFQGRINALVDNEVFKILTNPHYFLGLPWKEQRAQLFALVDDVTDEAVAMGNSDYEELLTQIKGTSLQDFRAKKAYEKKGLKAQLAAIQPKIDQTKQLMPDTPALSFAELTAREHELNTGNNDKLLSEIRALEQERNEYVLAKDAAVQSAKRTRLDVLNDVNLIEREKKQLVDRQNAFLQEEQWAAYEIKKNEAAIVELREEYAQVQSEKFNEIETDCPICGQPFPEKMLASKKKLFENGKRDKLKSIENTASYVKKCIGKAREKVEAAREDWDKILKDLDKQIAAINVPDEPASFDKEHDAKFQQFSEKLLALKEQQNDTSENDVQLKEIHADLQALKTIEEYTQEIARLQNEGRKLGQQLADVEKEEYVAQQFSFSKNRIYEDKINGLFDGISFKLFAYTQDGNASEACECYINNCPASTKNNAGFINGGLNIINVLCAHHHVCAPIFIDNAEGVNKLIATDAQQVRLVVTTDKTLQYA